MKSEEERQRGFDEVTFTVTCTMRRRWASQFLGMLKLMRQLGNQGSSREIVFFADGDGDFRPKFEMPEDPEQAQPAELAGERFFFDAG